MASRLVRLLALLCAVAALVAQPARASAPGPDVRVNSVRPEGLDTACTFQSNVQTAAHGEAAVAVWNDGRECARATSFAPGIASAWSADGGRTWTDTGYLDAGPQIWLYGNPAIAVSPDGAFRYAAFGYDTTHTLVVVGTSSDGGKTFGAPEVVARASFGAPFSGEASSELYDLTIASDSTASAYRGSVYLAWTQFGQEETIYFSRSTDGLRFSQATRITLEAAQRGRFPRIGVGPDGDVHVAWEGIIPTGGNTSVKSLWIRSSSDGGRTFRTPVRIAQLTPTGHPQWCGVFDPRPRAVYDGGVAAGEFPSIAVDATGSSDPSSPDFNPRRGSVYIALAARGADGDESDVFLFASRNRGATWAAPKRVNDDATRTDNYHPQVAIDESGTLALAWYDRRSSVDPVDTNLWTDLYATTSIDGGETFAPNARVSDTSSLPGAPVLGGGSESPCHTGERIGLAPLESGEFLVAWGDNRNATAAVPDLDVYADRFGLGR